MTDNEIIKALEGCWLEGNCEYCPMKKDNKCKAILRQIALDLINRQQAEIERLTLEYAGFQAGVKQFAKDGKKVGIELVKQFAEIIIADLPEWEYYLNNIVKEIEGEYIGSKND